jgi:hypothetical protein
VAGSHPRKSRICIAKEAAMHTQDTALARHAARAEAPPLTAIVPHERPEQTDGTRFELAVTGGGPDERALSVHYDLDVVTHRWIASIMDDTTGEVVRTVPSTQVLHQLAALRRPPLDLRA